MGRIVLPVLSLRLRIALLLGLLFAGLLAAWFWLRTLERRQAAETLAAERAARAQLLGHWIEFAGRALPQFTADAAQSDEFARLIEHVDAGDSRRQVVEAIGGAGAQALWILRADGTPRVQLVTRPAEPLPFPLAPGDAALLLAETPSPRFFAELAGSVWEICIRRLAGGTREWLAIGRAWDEAHLRGLEQLTESRVTLRGRESLAQPPADPHTVVLVRPLADWRGQPLRVLHTAQETLEPARAAQSDWRQAQVFFAFGLLVIAAMAVALRQWVLQPLRGIESSLAANDPMPAQTIARERHEFGRLAELVLSSFRQRAALAQEVAERARAQDALARSEATLRANLEERARLGRDLHDGVIQSLYAAGMGLAGIRTQLRPDQEEAAVRLEQTRAALNETIHDVRNFIIGLEPESLRLQTFSQAIGALLEIMRAMGRFESTIEIDESLAVRLTLSQRVHALQITREAVSNALRHGAATHVGIMLRTRGLFAEFDVRDNGRGFDTSDPTSYGRGLGNFAERARELGGELTIASAPGHGTTVTLVFSLQA